MKDEKLSIKAILGCFIILNAGWISAQDWPQWRGANRDGKVTGFDAPDTWPTELTQVWKATVGAGDATPALVGDKLYVFVRQGDDEVTLCLNANDGKEVWRDKYAALAATGPAARHPGPRSSPTVADGKIVTIGVGGILSCLDTATGEVSWRKDPFPEVTPMFFTSMSPIITDGKCIAHLGGAGNGAIIAYGLNTGDEKWRWEDEGPEYASPALLTVDGTNQIVTLTEKSIVGVGVDDGKLLWRLPFVPERRAYNAATPIVRGQTVIITGAARGTQAVQIEKQGDDFVADVLWRNTGVATQFNTPVLKENHLYGLTNQSNLFCINARTGETAWTDSTQHGRGGFAALLDAGSVILALPSHSELIAFEPNGEKYLERARIKVADTPVYAHPVISGKRMYVKDQETLTMWMME